MAEVVEVEHIEVWRGKDHELFGYSIDHGPRLATDEIPSAAAFTYEELLKPGQLIPIGDLVYRTQRYVVNKKH